jgi:hypothetical protein
MHGVNEYAESPGIDIRRDAVAKVEDMPRSLAVT